MKANARLRPTFDPAVYLASGGVGKTLARYRVKQVVFSQGGQADSVFYLHKGRAKLTVVSPTGKEATVTLLAAGDFIGEESLLNVGEHRRATVSTITECMILKIERNEMRRVLLEEHAFSDLYIQWVLARCMRLQADIVDHLFNSCERRLARILLLMADYDKAGKPVALIPRITQESLAEIVGTTRSHVSVLLNRFRKLGYIDYGHLGYKSRIKVHKSLLNAVLREGLSEENSSRPELSDPPS